MPIHDWTRVIPGAFHDFHHEWISTIKRSLNAGVLPSNYYAMAEQIAGGLGPGVLTLESVDLQEEGEDYVDAGALSGGGTALATTAHLRAKLSEKSEAVLSARRRKRIAIRHRSGDRVVAMIEIVSPGNKSDRHSIFAFVEKALELLEAGIHLLIIDLFPPTARDPQGIHAAIWEEVCGEQGFQLPEDKPLCLVSYEAGLEIGAYIEPVAVGQPLADMPLFLRPGRHVSVPLETSYQTAFEGVPQRWQKELT
ncbi:MAG: DUF4058 family protein [Pirellulaceae bacterium]|nr:DUF4058 family protein [Pirellulaceae bacterium]